MLLHKFDLKASKNKAVSGHSSSLSVDPELLCQGLLNVWRLWAHLQSRETVVIPTLNCKHAPAATCSVGYHRLLLSSVILARGGVGKGPCAGLCICGHCVGGLWPTHNENWCIRVVVIKQKQPNNLRLTCLKIKVIF